MHIKNKHRRGHPLSLIENCTAVFLQFIRTVSLNKKEEKS